MKAIYHVWGGEKRCGFIQCSGQILSAHLILPAVLCKPALGFRPFQQRALQTLEHLEQVSMRRMMENRPDLS